MPQDTFPPSPKSAANRLRFHVVLAFLLALAVSGFIVERLHQIQLQEQRQTIEETASRHLQLVTQSVNQALSATYALAALVQQGQGRVADFAGVATPMIQLYPGASSLQLAPEGIIREVIPLAGNEKAIGHNVFNDPKRNKEAILAKETGKLTLAGPFNLVQGGLGAVGRLPVFLADGQNSKKFWGFTSVLIRFPDVLNAANLSRLPDQGLEYALWRLHPDSGDHHIIATSAARPLEKPIHVRAELPNGTWTLSLAPKDGWIGPSKMILHWTLALLFSTLFAALAFHILRQPILLRNEVERQTRALRMSEARFESLFEQAPVALSVTTETTLFSATRWNQTWMTTFGYPMEVAQGKSGNDIGLWANPEDRDKYIETVGREGIVRQMDATMRRHDGELRQVAVSGRFIKSGEGRILLTHYDDITEAKRYQQEIQSLNAKLEARVQKRNADLRKSSDELWRAATALEKTQNDLARSEKMAALGSLVAGVAHELNTPIGNGITMSSSLTDRLKDFHEELTKGLKKSTLDKFLTDLETGLNIVFKNLHRAGELISSFKQVAVDQSSQVRRPFSLLTTTQEIATTLRPSFKRRKVELAIDIPEDIQFESYPGPLGQVIVNLINNALLHAFGPDQTGTIRIHVERLSAPDSDDLIPWIRLIVSDDGKGIPTEHLPRIFDPFFTTRMGSGGSGLGLNISFNIVTDLLGGRIEAQSSVGEGTRMVIDLPIIAPQTE